jgi:hypothetical protein
MEHLTRAQAGSDEKRGSRREMIYRGRRQQWVAGTAEVTLRVSCHLPVDEIATRASKWRARLKKNAGIENFSGAKPGCCFASHEPGTGSKPGYQTSDPCIPWAWSGRMQGTKHTLYCTWAVLPVGWYKSTSRGRLGENYYGLQCMPSYFNTSTTGKNFVPVYPIPSEKYVKNCQEIYFCQHPNRHSSTEKPNLPIGNLSEHILLRGIPRQSPPKESTRSQV